ncbi:5-oxoprolinase subunit PxpA [Ureibacillus aquaedulcis]|uniref:5-oxoprolinase subunit A n=1 Tax=Ureibacillus aquaedulcis TaxID=3058421 RepID=A0ABT8GW04_9BACL|nr:5-oxoprolinase subunit PxpA [Ureibacillus sp. BA0131]MDN4495595.1 5-oxoprolinase subunit PxpA [Ureibacillus sp. BA0131]
MMRIDINCDMGESFGAYHLGNDLEILDYVTSINVACGFHAGDPMIMARTVRQAIEKNVKIGAHPGYPDLQGFGRRNMDFSPEEIYNMIIYQVGALQAFVGIEKGKLHHVKPHGALYNQSANDREKAGAVIDAMFDLNPDYILYCLSGSLMAQMAKEKGLTVYEEAFSDRNYNEDGTLVTRSQKQALIESEEGMLQHVRGIISSNEVMTIQKKLIKINAQTLCIHGDGPHALHFARRISELNKI